MSNEITAPITLIENTINAPVTLGIVGGGGGASSWNDLTGTANDIPFDTTPTSVPTAEGVASWNADDNTLDIQTGLGGVTLQVGQEQHIKARNNSGATIANGSVVYLSGASGQRPTIALADADSDAHVASTIGLATADIGNNSFGMVTTSGLVRGVNTAGMTEGGPVYLSDTAGVFTQTAPTSNIVRVGWCIVAGNNGTVLVHVEKLSVKSVDVLDASTGGYGAADAAKLVEFDSFGGLTATGFLFVASLPESVDGAYLSSSTLTLYNGSGQISLAAPVCDSGTTITLPNEDGFLALTTQQDGSITTADVTGLDTTLSGKQATLVSGTNIKTVSGQSLLGSGDLTVSVSFANPTATIGLTATNGSASTAMRSDSAPALDQSIAPTWTASHAYSQSLAAGTTEAAVTLVNPTDATSGNQRWSPAMVWSGKGWKTSTTPTPASSQEVAFRAFVTPVQGSANPTGNWTLQSSIAGGAWTDRLTINSVGTIISESSQIQSCGTTSTYIAANGLLHFRSTNFAGTSTGDLFLGRVAAANLRQGNTDAAAPVAQTFSVQNVSTGTSNTAGANRNYDGSQGTGSGLGGAHVFRVATAGSSGTAQNAQQTALRIEQDRSVFVANVSAEPATPSGGGVFYVEAGALKYKGSSGTVTTIANA
jgi:hypothetical protein